MSPERWQQIEELFHAVLTCEPAKRNDFLAAKCAGDEALRREVDSLISSLDRSASFIETPAADVAAELLQSNRSFEPGQQIEHYQIARLLGSGGMGDVYLAEDLRLKRRVALKLLPPHFTVNPDRVRRFEREARAASKLNHPNIVTIYEIGRSNSTHFIVTEFVEGKTLRQLINEKPLTLNEALNVTIQVADALSGAHAAGIVHRDIKPENIMVRGDGYVKVLDFGLAKLTERRVTSSDLEMTTLIRSDPGLVVGTAQYMSPEQARGHDVGRCSDIWSMGIVLYELLAGHVPFTGETQSHVMVSLMEDPLPPLRNQAKVPHQLDQIVSQALCKDQGERYQSARQLARELKSLKQSLQASSKALLSTVPSTRPAIESDSVQANGRDRTVQTVASLSPASASHEKGISISKKARVVIALFCVGLVAATVGVYRLTRRVQPSRQPFRTFELVRLTNSGKVNDAAVSPDGNSVAYVDENEGRESIGLRQIANASDTQIVPPADMRFYGITFTNAGDYIFYIAKPRNNSIGTLYKVPTRGGAPVKIIVDVDGPISFSPDEKQFAFVRGSSTGERSLIVAGADGLQERNLASRTGYEAFTFGGTAWSPDGRQIVIGASYHDADGQYATPVAVDVSDGSLKRLSGTRWRTIGRLKWLPDGRGLVVVATAWGGSSSSQVWFLPYPDGEAQRVTRDLQDYQGVTLTANASMMVAKQTQTLSTMWVLPKDNTDHARPVLSHQEHDSYYVLYYSRTFAWTSDDQIVYTSLANGNPDIWSMTAQGTANRQLTSQSGRNIFPIVAPQIGDIVFVSDRAGVTNLWRMDADGSNQKRLTTGDFENWAWPSPDGRWLVYHSGNQGKRTIWRVPIGGGAAEQLTDYPSVCPVFSPDGLSISFYYRAETKAPWRLGIMPFNGGALAKTFEIPADVIFQSLVRWTPDGSSLALIRNQRGVSNIWTHPIDGGQPRQLTKFNSEQIFWFDWSRDGTQLAVSRGHISSDVVLIKDLNPN